VTLRVVVSGRAAVTAQPGGHVCRTRCEWRIRARRRLRLGVRPAAGVRFDRWAGACSGRRCALSLRRDRTVVARFVQRGDRGLQSWSFQTRCVPTRTTIGEIIGRAVAPGGVPLEAGGGFVPHLRGATQRHLLSPPCSVRGAPAFVEIDDVQISGPVLHQGDGDIVTHLYDDRARVRNPYLKTLRVEIDATWLTAGAAPPDFPAQPARVDVQGWVFWDTGPYVLEAREPSRWELHPLSAWLPAR
jgi:hypothetical protein